MFKRYTFVSLGSGLNCDWSAGHILVKVWSADTSGQDAPMDSKYDIVNIGPLIEHTGKGA